MIIIEEVSYGLVLGLVFTGITEYRRKKRGEEEEDDVIEKIIILPPFNQQQNIYKEEIAL